VIRNASAKATTANPAERTPNCEEIDRANQPDGLQDQDRRDQGLHVGRLAGIDEAKPGQQGDGEDAGQAGDAEPDEKRK
jgi:hypothetical protein